METIKNKVIVWGIDNFNTLALMRAIGEGDLDLFFLIKGSAGYAAKSKYCKAYAETTSVEDGFAYLQNHFANEDHKPIIIVSGDDTITFIDQNKEAFESKFIIPGTSRKGDVEKHIDKNTMTQMAEQIGIVCPQSKKVGRDTDIAGTRYPCLLKPSHEKPGQYNEFKFKICKNESELKRTLRLVRRDSEFILQQYIPKKEELLIYGARMLDGNTVIAGGLFKDRWSESGAGSHGYITADLPACVNISAIREFLAQIDYYGPFSFEYGLFENVAYFFEVNLRNDGTGQFFHQAGANIPLAYVYSCAGLDYTTVPTRVDNKQMFIDEVFDYENVLLGRITKKQWKHDLSKATAFRFYNPHDPAPYEAVRKGSVKQMVKEIVLKRFRLYVVFVLDKLGLRK